MEKVYKEAFVEVDAILKLMPIDLVSKIPAQFRQTISENKSVDYKCDVKEPLEEQNLKKETIAILGLIYRDFLASPEERERLQLEDAKELNEIKKKMQEQYDIENILKKRTEKKEEDQGIKDLTIYKKPNLLKKFFDKIKSVFGKYNF